VKKIEVVAAVIVNNDNLIYCVKRNNKGEAANKWEFPGGKIELGETKKRALKREIKEELSAEIKIGKYINTIHYQYNTFYLTMHVFYARVISGTLILSEHTDYAWLDASELSGLDWAPADLPILKYLI
jgi:8-oxo-dGTP diphosphatase